MEDIAPSRRAPPSCRMLGEDVLQRRHACRVAESNLRVALLRLFLRVHGKLVRCRAREKNDEIGRADLPPEVAAHLREDLRLEPAALARFPITALHTFVSPENHHTAHNHSPFLYHEAPRSQAVGAD